MCSVEAKLSSVITWKMTTKNIVESHAVKYFCIHVTFCVCQYDMANHQLCGRRRQCPDSCEYIELRVAETN
jgi:hypothetical protein